MTRIVITISWYLETMFCILQKARYQFEITIVSRGELNNSCFVEIWAHGTERVLANNSLHYQVLACIILSVVAMYG